MKNPVELIIKKRKGNVLTRDELSYLIKNYIEGNIPDYQISAFLMAVFFRGMTIEEVITLTDVYINSGIKVEFDKDLNTVDKHSTGGVGDKISLMLAPIVAACGAKIPMISGRGLGHTGGTLDKLESIPGMRTNYDKKQFIDFIDKIGFSIVSQSENMVPADKIIYALRDVTGTVESLPLITASIMSKKISEGAKNLVIDLKVGSGAFMKDIKNAKELGNLLIETGKRFNQNVSVIYTNMNSPLGEYIGNSLEILETIEYLKGKYIPDIDEITKKLGIEMLMLAKIFNSEEEALNKINEVIKNGKALEKFREFINLQNGNSNVCDDLSLLPQAKYCIEILAKKSGYIKEIDCQGIGYELINIDAGRKNINSKLNYASGAKLLKKIGDKISRNDIIGYLYSDDLSLGQNVSLSISDKYNIVDEFVDKEKMILDVSKF